MTRNPGESYAAAIDRCREDLLERLELLKQRRLEVELKLQLGNRRNHSFPVLSDPNQKKAGTIPAGLSNLWRVDVGPQLMATYGPLRQLLDRQYMLSRNTTPTDPARDRPLGPEPEGLGKLGLAPDESGSSLDDSASSHSGEHTADSGTDANADIGTVPCESADCMTAVRKTFWERLTEAFGEQLLPTSGNGIADYMKMAQGSVNRWQKGVGLPEFETCIDLAKRGKVATEWLITGRGPKRPMPVDEETSELLELWARLDGNGRHHVRVAAKSYLSMQRETVRAPTQIVELRPEKERT